MTALTSAAVRICRPITVVVFAVADLWKGDAIERFVVIAVSRGRSLAVAIEVVRIAGIINGVGPDHRPGLPTFVGPEYSGLDVSNGHTRPFGSVGHHDFDAFSGDQNVRNFAEVCREANPCVLDELDAEIAFASPGIVQIKGYFCDLAGGEVCQGFQRGTDGQSRTLDLKGIGIGRLAAKQREQKHREHAELYHRHLSQIVT